jgi:MGT family glycosyltransferase
VPPQPRSFLFVVPPLAGHVNPTAALGARLSELGHRVAWAGSELFLRPLLGPAAAIFGTGSKMLREQGEGGEAAIRSLWAEFVVPYARFSLAAVGRAIAEFRPDVVISDEHTPAGALAAQRRGVPWATMATSSMELGRPLRAEYPELDAWVEDQLRTLWSKAKLDPADYLDPRSSPRLVLALTSPALTGPVAYPPQYALVGPMLGARPPGPPFPWDSLDPQRRRVLVTTGTLATELAVDFRRRAVRALAGLADRVQAIVLAPEEDGLGELPGDALVLPRVPMLELLGRGALDAVVCHGGLNTVTEALAHGVPLVVAPIRHDQPINAAHVVAAGAGLRVDFAQAGEDELRKAVETVLDDPGPCAAAARVAEDFARAGGAPAAAALLERLADGAAARRSTNGTIESACQHEGEHA